MLKSKTLRLSNEKRINSRFHYNSSTRVEMVRQVLG
jgi:hypothetical protein